MNHNNKSICIINNNNKLVATTPHGLEHLRRGAGCLQPAGGAPKPQGMSQPTGGVPNVRQGGGPPTCPTHGVPQPMGVPSTNGGAPNPQGIPPNPWEVPSMHGWCLNLRGCPNPRGAPTGLGASLSSGDA